MSVTLNVIDLLQSLFTTSRSAPEGPSGSEAVFAAINELGDVTVGTYEAVLGEPDIEANEGLFSADPKIVIPVENTKYGDGGTLVFDVPNGADDPSAHFWNLLDEFNLTFEELGKLEGKRVPVRYSGGNVTVMWDQVNSSET